jgi:hypothetical protein
VRFHRCFVHLADTVLVGTLFFIFNLLLAKVIANCIHYELFEDKEQQKEQGENTVIPGNEDS